MQEEKIGEFNRAVELAISEGRQGYDNQNYVPELLAYVLKGRSR